MADFTFQVHKDRACSQPTVRIGPGLVALLALLVLAPALVRAQPTASFEPAPCPVPVPQGAEVECGYLMVPEDRSLPASGTIRLAVAILRSYSDDPAPDPVVYLEGGPGGSALEGLEYWLDSPLLEDRDFILLEQRGTRYSDPWLDCPELTSSYIESWRQGLSDEEEAAREVEAAIECRDRLRAEGVDLAAYDSAASAADLADLRQVLGYDEWNLYGISYGTRLALTTMRDHPEGIRSVILDSVYPPAVDGLSTIPPNTERVFSKLFDDCAADPVCRAAFPHLEADFYQLLERANDKPITVTVSHPDSGEQLRLPLDGDDLVWELFLAFYSETEIPYLPLVIEQASQGNYELLVPLTDTALRTILSGSDGMSNSVNCSEEVPFSSPAEVAAAAEAIPPLLRAFTFTSTFEICDLWGAGTVDPIEDEAVYSDIPTLVLAGTYDPITPPSSGRLAAATLSNSFYYEFPGLGHGVTTADCPASIAAAFLNNPAAEPDTSCLDELSGPVFLTTDDVFLTPAMFRPLAELEVEGAAFFNALLGFAGLFFLVALYLFLWVVFRLSHIWPSPYPRGDWLFHGLLAATAVLNFLFLAGLAGLVGGTLFSDWSMLQFGLPRYAALWLFVPWLSAILVAGLVLFLMIAWVRRYWSIARRVLYSVMVGLMVAFLAYLAYWDLVRTHF